MPYDRNNINYKRLINKRKHGDSRDYGSFRSKGTYVQEKVASKLWKKEKEFGRWKVY